MKKKQIKVKDLRFFSAGASEEILKLSAITLENGEVIIENANSTRKRAPQISSKHPEYPSVVTENTHKTRMFSNPKNSNKRNNDRCLYFPVAQFCIDNSSTPYILDRNRSEGDNHLYTGRYYKQNFNKTQAS